MTALPFLFAAFGIIWLVNLLFSYSIGARQKSVEQELQMLKAVLEEKEGTAAS
jgi:CcmD family protein